MWGLNVLCCLVLGACQSPSGAPSVSPEASAKAATLGAAVVSDLDGWTLFRVKHMDASVELVLLPPGCTTAESGDQWRTRSAIVTVTEFPSDVLPRAFLEDWRRTLSGAFLGPVEHLGDEAYMWRATATSGRVALHLRVGSFIVQVSAPTPEAATLVAGRVVSVVTSPQPNRE